MLCSQLTLQPEWRKLSTNKQVRCEDGDPFLLLVERINDMIRQGAEGLINDAIVDPMNYLFDRLPFPLNNVGRPLDRICWPTSYNKERCVGGAPTQEEVNRLSDCDDAQFGLENLCFYARIHQICSNEDMLTEYTQLFAQGYQTVDEVEKEFNAAFGESFQFLDPVR